MNQMSQALKLESKVVFNNDPYQLFQYDDKLFNDHEWDELLTYDATYRQDTIPESPLPSKELRRMWLSSNVSDGLVRWLLLNQENKLIARMALNYEKQEAYIGLSVDPSERRKGIGTYLLNFLVSYANDLGIKVIKSTSANEAAHCLCEKNAFVIVASSYMNRLYRKHIQVDTLLEWSKDIDVEVVHRIPDELIDEYAALVDSCTEMAYVHDQGYNKHEKSTRKSIREHEAQQEKEGIVPLICILRKDAHLIGVTQLYYYKNESWFVSQGLTGVLRAYQGKGYGKAIKAYGLLELLKEVPDFLYIETSNNIVNDAMNRINNSLGFKAYEAYKMVERKLK